MNVLHKSWVIGLSSTLVAAISIGAEVGDTHPIPNDDSSQSAPRLEEIIVTAERREQRLQDVAATVQAFTPVELDRSALNADFQNLQVLVPGLQISQNEGSNEIYIRGVGNQDSEQFTSEGATAVHYNNIFLPRSRGIGPMLYDIERVEVNKGPQGTLRGRNATAGSINILPQKPTFDTIGGYGEAGVGNYNERDYEGALNIPIFDSLAVRGAVFSRDHNDYFKNGLHNGVSGVGAEDELAVRGSVRWQPTDDLSAVLFYDQSDSTGSGFPGNFFGQALSEGYTVEGLGDKARLQNFLQQGYVKNKIKNVTTVVNYDFGPVIVEYNGGYLQDDFFTRNARRPFQNGVVIPSNTDPTKSVGASFAFDPDNFGTLYIGEDSKSQVHELRVYSPNSARFRWTTGAFYMDEKLSGYRFDVQDRSNTQASLGGETRSDDVAVKSLSFYSDGTLDVTSKLRIKGGLRWTDDKKSNEGYQVQYQFNFPGVSPDQIRFGTPGYLPTGAGQRRYTNPLQTTPANFFLDGVETFGSRDTLGNLIRSDPNGVSLTLSPGGASTRRYQESYVDWRWGAEYDLAPHHLLYVTVSTGSHSGGINPILVLPNGQLSPSNFKREQLTDYELGSKNEFAFGPISLRFNADLFFYKYKDQVLNTAVAGNGSVIAPGQPFAANAAVQNVNVGRSSIRGAEIETNALIPGGFDIGILVTFLDSRYDEAKISDGRQFVTNGVPPNVDISGNPLVNVSKWNLVAHLGETFAIRESTADWRVTAAYRSQFFASPFAGQGYDASGKKIPLAQMPTLFGQPGIFFNDKVDGLVLWNAVLGTNFGPNKRHRFEIYGANLTNEAYPQKQIINYFVNINFVNIPRTFGARFSTTF